MRNSSYLVVFLLVACGGSVATSPSGPPSSTPDAQVPVTDAATGTGPETSVDASSVVDSSAAKDAAGDAVVATSDPACMVDADCDEQAGGGLGRCWRDTMGNTSSCLCKQGAYKQPSGRCAPSAPPDDCASTGGSCTSWAVCSGSGGARTLATSCGGGDQVCCVSQCKPTVVSGKGCYQRGTDAAYSPVCTGGFITCLPGDTPDIEIFP